MNSSLTSPKRSSIAILLVLFFITATAVQASPGQVDVSFNAGTFTNFTGSGLHIDTIKQQTDGKILIGGVFEKINGVTQWGIARLNQDGTRDTSFNSPFIYTVTQTQVSYIEIQPDGKILVGGNLITPSGTKRLMRLNTDGTVDPAFSADINQSSGIFALQSDGKIVCGTSAGVVRLNADGSTDLVFTNLVTNIREIISLPGGLVVAAGDYSTYFVVARFLPTGALDNSFNGNGLAGVGFGELVFDLALQTDGKVVVTGNFTMVNAVPRNKLARLLTDGTVDPNFNTNISLGEAYDSQVLSDGKIFTVGRYFFTGDTAPYQTARFNADGSLDTSFQRLVEGNSSNVVFAAGLQADGRLLVGGSFSDIGGVARQFIARLLDAGAPANSPPVLSNVAMTSSIDENGSGTLSGNISDTDAGDAFALAVDWGDGSTPQTFNYPAGTTSFSETHVYLDDDPTGTSSDNYSVGLTLSDGAGGSDTDSAGITVNNVAPTLSNVAASPSTITAGQSTTVSGNISDPGTADSQIVVIAWGDGSSNTTIPLAAGVTSFNSTHQYNTSGAKSVTVTATDDDGGISNTGTTSVTVNPVSVPLPNAPSKLAAKAITLSQIDLSWTDNSNNEDGFLIERCVGGGKCTTFVQIGQTAANVRTFSDTGLTAATNYAYRVRAFNATGNSAYSNTAKTKTLRR